MTPPGPFPRPDRVALLGLLDSFGLGTYLALAVLFLARAVELSAGQVGVVLGVSGLASLLGALPMAALAERITVPRALVLFFGLRGAALLALAAASSFPAALAASLAAGALSRGIGPLVESARVAGAAGEDAAVGLARLRRVRNVGMACGALPAGLAVVADQPVAYRAALWLTVAMFLACALLARGLPVGPPPPGADEPRRSALRDPLYLWIVLVYGGLTLSALVLGIGLPLWLVEHTRVPLWAVPLTQVLNTLLVVAFQVRVSRGSSALPRARRLVLVSGVLAAAAVLLLPTLGARTPTVGIGLVLLVAVLLTASELCFEPGVYGLALAHTPPGRGTGHLAALNLGFAAATVVGPPIVAASTARGGAVWTLWAGAFLLLGLAGARVPDPRPRPSARGTRVRTS